MGSISMGRLLVAGMAGGAAFMLASLLAWRLLMIPLALGVFVGGLVLTHPRHGIPLYRYALITARTRLLLAAVQSPTGWQARLAQGLGLPTETLTVETDRPAATVVDTLDNLPPDAWEILPSAADTAGFEVVTDTFYLEG